MSRLTEFVFPNSQKTLSPYREFGGGTYRQIQTAGKKLRGKRIIHINATPVGGGVVEMLQSQVPLERSLGIRSHWFYLRAPGQFFAVTKKIHNLLQGKPGSLNEREIKLYKLTAAQTARSVKTIVDRLRPDLFVIHDPQPLPLIEAVPRDVPAVLRLHIDLSTPAPSILRLLEPWIHQYSGVVVSSKQYFRALPLQMRKKARVIFPAIDPLSEKNQDMNPAMAQRVLEDYGINTTEPLLTQVSRFDPWKNPLGVIQTFYKAKNDIPDLQLALAGFIAAQDDPEAVEIFRKVKRYAHGDPDIFLFANPQILKNITNDHFIKALLTASTVVIQNSTREGFGLTMTEAMWKGKTVVARPAEGAKLQIKNRVNGIIARSDDAAAKSIVELIKNQKKRELLGKAAHASVQKHFLITRYLLEHLKLYAKLVGRRT